MFSRITKKARRAFTLVEIMIVVLIIGILLAIAIPNFVRARETARTKSCIANLEKIQGAKEQFAMDNKKPNTYSVQAGDIYPAYIKNDPVCPSGGNYLEGLVGEAPTCSYGNTHVLP